MKKFTIDVMLFVIKWLIIALLVAALVRFL